MNPIEAVLRRADTAQQGHTAPAFVFGVIKKFGDDNGGVLVANLAYAVFVSIFPLLLILATTLGLLASGDPELRQQALNAVASQVPLIGHQLTGNLHQLHHSSIVGLIIGIAGLIWGTSRLAQAGIFTMAQVWNLPGPARPGYVPRLGRAALFLGVLGLGVIITTSLTGLASFGHHAGGFVLLSEVLAGLTNVGMYLIGFRVLTPKGVPLRQLLPGALAGGVAWTVLQALGTYLVHRSLHSDAVYGVFATVLGLIAWIYLGVEVCVYAAEINVVLSRRLWPRGIIQPPLTEADRSSMALQALQNQRREEQHVEVTFNDRPADARPAPTTPETPGEVAPPASEEAAESAEADGEAGDADSRSNGAPTPEPAAHTSAPDRGDHE
jgi:YihY family inner membrane protein